MVSTSLDVVRAIHEMWERGDFTSAEWAHPEIEYVIVDGPAPGRWTGRAQMAKAFREILSAWEGWRVEADEYRELDPERVLAIYHFSARGKRSGLEAEQVRTQVASVFEVSEGKVTSLVQYWDPERALADLGLA